MEQLVLKSAAVLIVYELADSAGVFDDLLLESAAVLVVHGRTADSAGAFDGHSLMRVVFGGRSLVHDVFDDHSLIHETHSLCSRWSRPR